MCTSQEAKWFYSYPLIFLFNVVIIRHFNTVDTFGNGRVRAFMHLTDIMIRWSPGIHSEISPKKFHGRVQVFTDLTHVMIQWSLGISTMNFDLLKSVIPAWILEETESVLINLGKCSKPKDVHKPRIQKREKPSQREVYHCADWFIPWSGWRQLS